MHILRGQMSLFDLATSFGKTSRDASVRQEKTEKARTSERSSRSSCASFAKELPTCLCLKSEAGSTQAYSTAWETMEVLFPSRGDFTTRSITECRKDGPVCVFYATTTDTARGRSYLTFTTGEAPRQIIKTYLRDVLEPWSEKLLKYLLSAKACQGILNRAKRRGKKLPEMLEKALIWQSRSKSGQDAPAEEKGF